jgi:hypothetical protein
MKYDRGNAYDEDEDDLADKKIKINSKKNKKSLKNIDHEDIDS